MKGRQALVAGATALLTSCSSSGEKYAEVPPPPSRSAAAAAPTETASPSRSAAGVKPSATSKPTSTAGEREQVIAAAKEYFAERTRAASSGNTSRLRTLSVSSCPCIDFAETIEKSHEEGRLEGFAYKVRAVGPISTGTGIETVTLILDTSTSRLVKDTGEVKTFAGRPAVPYIVALQRESGRLLVLDVNRVAQS